MFRKCDAAHQALHVSGKGSVMYRLGSLSNLIAIFMLQTCVAFTVITKMKKNMIN